MQIYIRLENPSDYRPVEELTREAFWGFTHPTCDEHYLVHILRTVPAFIPALDFVAEINGKLVGNVMYSKAEVVDENDNAHEVITFGPLSVLPEHWRSGVGTALMKHSILRVRELGYRGIVFHGHPDYYPSFGFQNAQVFGITNHNGKNYDALMAMELYDGALNGIRGKFYEHPVFDVKAEEAEKYNKLFSKKEPASMLPISVLPESLPEKVKVAFLERGITTLAWLNRLSGREMLAWDGMDTDVLMAINAVLKSYNYAPKLLPGCEILERAKLGIKVVEELA